METKSIAPETIISGFSYFLGLVLICLFCVDANISNVVEWLSQISAGFSILLASIAFGASHFLGTLATRIISDIISLFRKEEKLKELAVVIQKNPESAAEYYMSWRARSFFLSMCFAISLILIASVLLDYRVNSGKTICVILSIGIPILILTIVAVFTTTHYFRTRRELLLSKGK